MTFVVRRTHPIVSEDQRPRTEPSFLRRPRGGLLLGTSGGESVCRRGCSASCGTNRSSARASSRARSAARLLCAPFRERAEVLPRWHRHVIATSADSERAARSLALRRRDGWGARACGAPTSVLPDEPRHHLDLGMRTTWGGALGVCSAARGRVFVLPREQLELGPRSHRENHSE